MTLVPSYLKYSENRDKHGLTDYQVANETNIPKSTFSEWKSNRSAPKTDKLLAISKLLEVSIEDLLEQKEKP